ncbi:amidohydrolase family protein [Marinococcus sp. PL1-022]|uniref:amidohydrolase family protein n=1 Tax=Marinococcus sp. PL1-022 TaxID=3095363 RepID=UPI0029C400D8|nr:amidohydrolase family protein [Marinococcus sp. PL1-022]MDX6153491.1 amidohydrolase family protein [Marinococcus sp. PL1-022]
MNNAIIKNVKIPSLENEVFHAVIMNGRYEKIVSAFSYHAEEMIKQEGSPNIEIIDAEGWIMLPTFTDIHTHLDKAYTYEQIPNKTGTLVEAIENYKELAGEFEVENIKKRMKKVLEQALANGTGRMRTHINVNSGPGGLKALQTACGLKAEYKNLIDLQVIAMIADPIEELKEDSSFLLSLIKNDIDGVGGAPHLSENCTEEIKILFAFAAEYQMLIDLHVDEQDDPAVRSIEEIIAQVKHYKYQRKTTVGHLCTLSAMETNEALSIIKEIVGESINIVTLPAANLCLQGRDDQKNVRRGTTRVKEFLANNACIAAASDNINDPFHPFGNADMLLTALMSAYANHLTGTEDIKKVFDMITKNPSEIFHEKVDIKIGEKADFVLLEGSSLADVLANQRPGRKVFRNGHWTSIRTVKQTVERGYNIHA